MCKGGCRPDVDVITANPKTAGVARWNFFALWGHRLDKGEDAALDYTTKARPLPLLLLCMSCYPCHMSGGTGCESVAVSDHILPRGHALCPWYPPCISLEYSL